MPGEVLLPLSIPQRSGGERLTNSTALFRSLTSNVTFPPCPYGASPVMLGGLGSESSGLAETAQGAGWSCGGEHLCILIGRGPSSQSPRGLTQRPAHSSSPRPYQVGHYWPSLAPFLSSGQSPRKAEGCFWQCMASEWSAWSETRRILVHCTSHGSMLALAEGDNKTSSQS